MWRVYKIPKSISHYGVKICKDINDTILPNQELSVLYGGSTLNYGRQLSPYVPYMLRVNMTRDLAHLQLSDLQAQFVAHILFNITYFCQENIYNIRKARNMELT